MLLFILLMLATFSVHAADRFPEVTGKALTGEEVTLPTDLEKPYTLLAVAFLRQQQADVDTWIPNMEKIEDAREDFAFYEIPTIREMGGIRRWFIYRGMRGGIPSERARARTVTLHIDKAPFRKELGIETEDSIYLFLLDAEGAVVWRTQGEWSPEKEAELRKQLP